MRIDLVADHDLPDLLPLLRGYCDFYEVAPGDDALLALARELIADPDAAGFQLIARDGDRAVGFATVFWTRSTLSASRTALMNDLFVEPGTRGSGLADRLIAACAERAKAGGAAVLTWQTAADNLRAQAVYERVGAARDDRWLDYELELA